tara:strand:- start:454 stop:615 length:162 start_codon:yes stop_codon:yes gene_type:complete
MNTIGTYQRMNLSRQSFTVRAVAVDEEQVNTVGDRSAIGAFAVSYAVVLMKKK